MNVHVNATNALIGTTPSANTEPAEDHRWYEPAEETQHRFVAYLRYHTCRGACERSRSIIADSTRIIVSESNCRRRLVLGNLQNVLLVTG